MPGPYARVRAGVMTRPGITERSGCIDMATSRARQPVRIAVRAATDTTKAAVEATAAQVVAGAAAVQERISVRRLDPNRRRDWIITYRVPDAIGSPAYASTAWEITHRLQDTGTFAIVEADVPVGAFDPGRTPPASFTAATAGQTPRPRTPDGRSTPSAGARLSP
jgi:hypothetical protein